MHKIVFVFLMLTSVTSCVNFSSESGVENLWRQQQSFINGESTSKDILKALGPPSQILALGKKSVYYYLKEEVSRQGLILVVFNQTDEIVKYDRAIFIFNEQDVLEDYSYSKLPSSE
jgi:hypothetical protein